VHLGLNLGLTAIGTRGGAFDAADSNGAAALLEGETQGFAVDFTDMSALVRDTGTPANNFAGNPNDLLAYTSPSTKYVRNAAGIYVAGTMLRTDHDADGNPLGLLVEEARTNICLRSGDFSNTSVWTDAFGGCTITGGQTAPDGTSTAVLLQQVDNINDSQSQSIILATGTVYTWSVFVKNVDATQSRFSVFVSGGSPENSLRIFLDWSDGVPSEAGDSPNSVGGIERFAGGWYRVWATFTSDASVASHAFAVFPERGTSATLGAIWWGSQVEAGASPTSYIPTEGSAVQRNGDRPTLALSATPLNDMTSGAHVLSGFANFIGTPTGSGGSHSYVLQLDDGTVDDRIVLYQSTHQDVSLYMETSDAGNAGVGIGPTVTEEEARLAAFRCTEDDYALSVDGETQATDSGADVLGSALTTIRIGHYLTPSLWLNSHIKQIALVPRAWNDATLESKVGN
jgi:hypothetical protein